MKTILLSLLVTIALTTTVHAKACPSDNVRFCSQYKLAEQGDMVAQYNLGVMYRRGEGVARDNRKVVRWYRKVAEQGDAKAQYHLGNMYWRGEGVIEYKRETYIWFSIAKANGSEKATERLHKLNWHDYLTTAEIKSAKREAAQRLVATVNY